MPGEGEEVTADVLDAEGDVPGALGGIDEGGGSEGFGLRAHLADGIDGAEGVGNVNDGEELDLGGEELFKGLDVECAIIEHGDVLQGGSGALGGELPGDEITVMLHAGAEDDITRLQISVTPGIGDEVDAFSGAASEDNLIFGRSRDEAGDGAAGGLKAIGGSHAEGVEGTVDVGVVTLVVVRECLDDAAGLLGGGGAVEVDERMAVDLLLEDGEVVSDARPVHDRRRFQRLAMFSTAMRRGRGFRPSYAGAFSMRPARFSMGALDLSASFSTSR